MAESIWCSVGTVASSVLRLYLSDTYSHLDSRSCPDLSYINLGACVSLASHNAYNDVCTTLATNCRYVSESGYGHYIDLQCTCSCSCYWVFANYHIFS